MRNNKSLAAAITTALSFTPWTAWAAACEGNQFENVQIDAARADCIDKAVFNSEGLTKPLFQITVPQDRFDFTGGQSVIDVYNETDNQVGGVPFAAELFGSGTLTLPTPVTSGPTGGNSGQYMAVIYAVDGEIPVEFDMTFTLDNGATFADNPILGVRDGGTGATPAILTTPVPATGTSGCSMTITTSSLTEDMVFRFDNSTTLYQVATADTATTPSAVTFFQLGSSDSNADKVFDCVLPTTTPVKAYPSAGKKLGPVVSTKITGAITGTLMGTTGATTLEVVDSSKFTQGWSYMCNSFYSADTATSYSVFTVTGKTTGTPHKLFVSVQASPIGKGGNNGKFGSTIECSQNADIYRVHIKGDTTISVTSTDGLVKNRVYQFDNKGATAATMGASAVISHQTAQYTVTNVGTGTIDIRQIGSGANAGKGLGVTLQDGESLYDTSISLGDDWSTINSASGVPKSAVPSAAGKSSATFNLKAQNTGTLDLRLVNNDQIMLLYKLGNANALAEPGQSINMTVELKTPTLGMVVNPQRTIKVARSVQAVNAQLKSVEGGSLHIAVSTGSTQFSGEVGTGEVGYKDNYVAQIGKVVIEDGLNKAVMEDGVTPFKLGAGVTAENSTLTITGGQFQASTALPGKVSLHISPDGPDYTADSITTDAAGWTAIWNLNTTELASIANGADKQAYVWIRTDGTAPINRVEEKPHATLSLNYDTATYQDVTEESDIRKITQDGTVCTVYNVPPPKAGVIGADTLSIRVTNDSALSGKLKGKLYSQEGGDPIWADDLTTEEVPAGATVRFTSEDLATITGTTWDGRAVLEISTILPKIEVLALIRQNGIRMAPLSSLSAGAHGTSCAQD